MQMLKHFSSFQPIINLNARKQFGDVITASNLLPTEEATTTSELFQMSKRLKK